jgi:two-component system, OmpR family, response regulator
MHVSNDLSTRKTKANAPTVRPLRVFLVEDSEVIRERLTESISSLPNVDVVGHADTEAHAITALSHTPCDVLLLDLQLRTGHGFNVLKAVRARPYGSQLIVIVLTNFTSSQYRDRCMEMGADYFLDKSREYDRVCDVLEDLALHRPRRMR